MTRDNTEKELKQEKKEAKEEEERGWRHAKSVNFHPFNSPLTFRKVRYLY